MWTLETRKTGIDKILKPYQVHVLKCLTRGEPRLVWSNNHLWESCKSNGINISRASVINFTKAIAKDGLIQQRKASGKGGYRFDYITSKTMVKVENHIIKRLLESINEIFPRQNLQNLINIIH